MEIYSAFSNNNTIPVLFVVWGSGSWHEGLGWIAKKLGLFNLRQPLPLSTSGCNKLTHSRLSAGNLDKFTG